MVTFLFALACVWALVERYYGTKERIEREGLALALTMLEGECKRLTKANASLLSEVQPLKNLTKHLHEQLTAVNVRNQMLQRKLKESQ